MRRHLPLCLIVALLIAFRIAGSAFAETLPNFQPLAALFFCGALLAPGWRGLGIPLAVWAVTFPLGVGHTANPLDFATTIVSLALTFFLGKSLATQRGTVLVAGSALAAVAFHGITCGAAWLSDPLYAKTLAGLQQSLWSGPVGSELPSWVFLRNLVAANALFTAIFVLARRGLPQALPAPAARPA